MTWSLGDLKIAAWASIYIIQDPIDSTAQSGAYTRICPGGLDFFSALVVV